MAAEKFDAGALVREEGWLAFAHQPRLHACFVLHLYLRRHIFKACCKDQDVSTWPSLNLCIVRVESYYYYS